MGRRIAEELERGGVRCTIVELNPATVRTETRSGKPIIFGDVANPEVLESAGIGRADALILTIPDDEASARACALARRRTPDIIIAARAVALSGKNKLREMGADHVTVDEVAAAEEMSAAVIQRIQDR